VHDAAGNAGIYIVPSKSFVIGDLAKEGTKINLAVFIKGN
jgi:hypothetical protein